MRSWLDGMDTNERWALLKFLSGALRVGVSARLAKLSLAKAFGHNPEEIEELWHGLRPPYVELFQWLEGKAPRPVSADVPTFKPLMLSNPLEDKDWEALDLKDMAVEWKWDGIRVQFASKGNVVSLFLAQWRQYQRGVSGNRHSIRISAAFWMASFWSSMGKRLLPSPTCSNGSTARR